MQMATRALAGLCLVAIVAVAPASTRAQEQKPQDQSKGGGQRGGHPSFWWKDVAVQKELGMTSQQAEKIESIWRASFPAIKAAHKELDVLKTELDRLIRENTADEKVVALQLDRVEARRSEINKGRDLMLYRMHRVLTPEQYQGLTTILERRKARSGRRPSK